MKAMVLEDKGQLTYTDVPEPEVVGPRPVLVRIAAVGVCGSDILRFAKGKAYHYPLILGHEFSAVVEEAPADSRFRRGARVAVFPLLPDPRDPFARIGEYAVSSGYDYFGSRRDGAFAERLWVPEDNLIPVPDDVPLVHAACVEPAAVALHAMLKLRIRANATALVIGGGPIGAFAAQWLRILGCSRVIIADIDGRKLDIMRGLGFEVIDAASQDTVAAAKDMTSGRGVDCSVEASGLPATFLQALQAAAVFGQVMLLGDLSGDVTLPAPLVSSVLRRELTLYGTWNSKITPPGNSEWEMVLRHMGHDLQVAPLISHTPALGDGPQMFSDMASRRVWYNKVVFAIAEEARAEAEAGVALGAALTQG
ncbi:MAG: galactitol-1-phosphate 5-dehydrogenase [Anaerolineae bacterium]